MSEQQKTNEGENTVQGGLSNLNTAPPKIQGGKTALGPLTGGNKSQ